MTRAQVFIERCKVDGIYIRPGRGDLVLTGPDAATAGAEAVLREHSSLADEIEGLLSPSVEDLRSWLKHQSMSIREEYAARVSRLTAANIPDAELVALRTTYRDNNSPLPERLKPVLRGGDD